MTEINPVALQVFRNTLVAVSEEMAASLQRTAYSTNIKTRQDFSCGIFDASLRMLAQSFHQPTHLGSLAILVPRVISEYDDIIEDGDSFLVNNPYSGATHLPDVSLITPYFYKDEPFAYFVNLAHYSDIGGKAPGSIPGDASEIHQEGLIIPPIKLLRGGEIDKSLFDLILTNVRNPKDLAGDIRAQVAANFLGMKRLEELLERYTKSEFDAYADEMLNYAERVARGSILKLPDGEYYAEDFMDNDGITPEPIKVAVEVKIEGDEVRFDLSNSDRQRTGPVNSTYAQTFAGLVYPIMCLLEEKLSPNEGFYRPIKINAPEGLVVNARYPAPIGGGWETSLRCTDVVIKALSDVIPDRVMAAPKGCICNIAYGGKDPRTGGLYAFYETVAGGYGARPSKDGIDGIQAHSQNTQNAPIEELETIIPVLVLKYELIEDSGGAGKFRGGLGLRRDLQFNDHEATFSILSDRKNFAPYGLFGGLPARASRYILNPDSGSPVELNSKCVVRLSPGDVISIQTPGGGGYGSPGERSKEQVIDDVRDGKVSIKTARERYGVEV